jgi:hypothetical protein
VESGDRRLGRSESGMWKAGTSKVVVLAVLVMDLSVALPRASIECIDHMLVYGPSVIPGFYAKTKFSLYA